MSDTGTIQLLGGNVGIGTTGPSYKLDVRGGTVAGAGAYVNTTSHSSLKENFQDISVLEAIGDLRINEWEYKPKFGNGDLSRHLYPTTDEFYAVFGLGRDEFTISPEDIAGVALKGVQEQQEILTEIQSEVQGSRLEAQSNTEEIVLIQDRLLALETDQASESASLSSLSLSALESFYAGQSDFEASGSGVIENWTFKVASDSAQVAIGIDPEKNEESAKLSFSAIDSFSGETKSAFLWYDADDDELKSSKPIVTASGAYDIAEDFLTDDPEIEAGDVVVISETGEINTMGIEKSQTPYEQTMVGIVSERPGIRLSQEESQVMGNELQTRNVPVALAGRVPVKIAPDSAPIKAGDYLTSSSQPGKAMKATSPGAVMGKALEDWDPEEGKEKILVLIGTNYYAGNPSTSQATSLPADATHQALQAGEVSSPTESAEGIDEANDLEIPAVIQKAMTALTDRVNVLENLLAVENDLDLEDNFTSQATFEVFENLQVLGKTTTGDLGVTGKITNGLLIIDGLSESSTSQESSLSSATSEVFGASISTLSGPLKLQENALGSLEIMGGKIVFDTEGNIKVEGNIEVKGKIKAEEIELERGVTFKDQATGEYYCVTIVNGELVQEEGKCNN